ncbi:MAG: hypothetical protein OXH36_02830 [Bdellovibrionales bacterium]|nr:hypothetical protein [Bdellovibrionales bacterium]
MRQYLCIDDNFYEGISKLSNETIENFSDLSAKLKTYEHSFQGLTEGSLSKIKGHIAESHIAEHFKEAGIAVTWPEASNQEGFDLLFNGNPIQSKFIEDANNLVEHFQKYPDIPVVIPSDANNIPETAFHFDPSEGIGNLFNYLKDNPENAVIVDHKLSNVNLTESIEQGSDLATGTVDFNFPWVTAAFSSFRELNLLINNDTDISSSIKNMGLDVAGVGIGAMTGGEIGAIAGSIIPGPGTVIGAGMGVVIGAIMGRNITNDIKQEPLKEAIKKLKKSRRRLKLEAKKIQEKYNQQFNKFKKEEQNKINCKAKESKETVRRKISTLRRWAVNREKLSDSLKTNLLKNIEDQGQVKHIKKKETPSLIEYLWLDQKMIMLIAFQRNINKYKKYFIESFTQNKFKDKGDLFQEFSKKGLCQKYILSEIKKSEEQRKTKENYLMNEIKKEQAGILKLRAKSMKRLASKVEKYIEQIKRDLFPYIKDINSYHDLLEKETKKLGRKPA